MKRLALALILIALALGSGPVDCGGPGPAQAGGHQHLEEFYQFQWCQRHGGIDGFHLPDGTIVDCLTPTHAVEVDFGPKWYEGIGQALHYGLVSGKRAGLLLIMEHPADLKFIKRARAVIEFYRLPIDLWETWPPPK